MHFDDFLMSSGRSPPVMDFTPFFNSEVKVITSEAAIMHISEGFLL